MAINFSLRPSFVNRTYKGRTSAPVILERLNLELMNKNMNDITESIIAKKQLDAEKAKLKAKEIRKFSPDISGVWSVDIPEITESLEAVYAQANADLDRYGRLSPETKMLEAELVLKVEASKQHKTKFDGAVTAFEGADAGVYDPDYYNENLILFKDTPIGERDSYLNLLEKYQPSLFEQIEIPDDLGSQSFTLATGTSARVSEEIRTTTFDDLYVYVGNDVFGSDYKRQLMIQDFNDHWSTLTESQKNDLMENARTNPMEFTNADGQIQEYTYWDDDNINMQTFDMALRYTIDSQFSTYIGQEVDRTVGAGVSGRSSGERDAAASGQAFAQWLYNTVYNPGSYGGGESITGGGYFSEGLGTFTLTPAERTSMVSNAAGLNSSQRNMLNTWLGMGQGQNFQTSTEEIKNELVEFRMEGDDIVMVTTRDLANLALGSGSGYSIIRPSGADNADIGGFVQSGLSGLGSGGTKAFYDELEDMGAVSSSNLNTFIFE